MAYSVALAAAIATFLTSGDIWPSTPPQGVFLWFPKSSVAPNDDDCRTLVDEVQPSRSKAEDWLWGRVPEGDGRAVEFYLFLSEARMEPTFAAEGDYDYGAVTWGATVDGTTTFVLTPDYHPDTTIEGNVTVGHEAQVVELLLNDVPLNGQSVNRTTYFCRFEEKGVET
ncbi:MAG: hypothetical protein ABIL01_24585 [Pseudomonadota bacterium]